MSEYQYYEFRAIDRPLDRAAQQTLRSVSSRAQITSTSFVNHYEWGDFRGDPVEFVENWFDLHLYFANWGTRRLMMRLPARFLKREDADPFLRQVDWVELWASGDDLIVDIHREEAEAEDYWEDDTQWLSALAPLRSEVLSGDLRMFYLLWLTAIQDARIADDEIEPLPGIGPLTDAFETFAEFFGIDSDLLQAAAESGEDATEISKAELRAALAAIAERDKTELLVRLVEGDPHVGVELHGRLRKQHAKPAPRRTVGALRMRAREIAEARERTVAEQREAERRLRAEEAERARRARLEDLKRRGAGVWRQVEEEIERRNASGYDRAASLLSDLRALAAEEGDYDDFNRRLASIRARHEKKGKFIERLVGLETRSDGSASGF
ncbi:hypothetical protein AU467_17305 [Mesorhizobium loti]|uniref:Uncharacterized protein n=1 Tax=Rhizobium loti TaxID=381 RepID=A0A117N423_RHILI|nr:hypothetical protein AU467_17305 [Mesorhizobium loti]